MTARLQQTTPRKMMQALQKLGFKITRIKGSHHILRKGDHETCVALHNKQLSRGLQTKILKQAGLTIEDIRPYL